MLNRLAASAATSAALSAGEVFSNNVPVNHIPECGDVVRAFVLIVQVVSVLPDIEAEDGLTAT